MEQSKLNDELLDVFSQKSTQIDYAKALELLKLGADPLWVKNERNECPLYGVCSRHPSKEGKQAIIAALVERGLSVSYKDKLGLTALHNVAFKGALPVLNALLNLGSDVNLQDNQGNTPLHLACSNYYFFGEGGETPVEDKIFKLLEFGADASIQNSNGITPLDTLRNKNFLVMVEKIEAFISERECESSDDRGLSISSTFKLQR